MNEQIFDDFAAHVSPGKVDIYRAMGMVFPLGRREGPYVWDADGTRRLINCHVNGGTFNLGHRHPELVDALVSAVQSVDIGNHHLPSAARARLAARLAFGELRYAVFATCGGEAIDLAIKVARRATRRKKIVSIIGGYHGHTGLACAAGEPKYADPFGIDRTEFARVPWNDLDAMRAALAGGDVAAVILETIPATLGMPLPAPGYLAGVRALATEHGAVYIADEVQTGLGRTGKLWGVEHWGVVPDALVTAKGLSGGLYPIAATLLTSRLADVFRDDPFAHISTFGGSELGCAVAEKVLEITTRPGFLDRVTALGARVAAGLKGPFEVRAVGAFMGVKLRAPVGPLAMKACYDEGLLTFYAGNDPTVLQLLPPLLADDALADEIAERASRALARFA
jgi:acetylornithine/succinyldiaminopimelate/putrescine aminotransferase